MRVFYTVFFFLSALLCLPVDSEASLPPGVHQAAQIIGTAVEVAGVYTILPSTATAVVPAVGTASAAAGTASTGVAVPLLVGGVALAGGYYVGGMLATDLYNLYEAATSKPDQYPNLKNALASDGDYIPVSVDDFPPSGSTITAPSAITGLPGNYRLTGTWSVYEYNDYPNASLGTNYFYSGYFYQTVKLGPGRYSPLTSFYGASYRIAASPTSDNPTWQPPAGGMVPPATAVPNMTNPDGTLKPEIESEVKNAIASGDASPSGVTGSSDSGTLAGQLLTPELMEAFGRSLAQQAATSAANQTVQQLQDALAADPTNATLAQQLSQAQAELAQAQAAQAAAEAAAAEAAGAAEVATSNLGPANTYDATINTPESKNITGLMNTFFDNSPLLGIVRSFQISTTDQQALFSFGTFWGQEITVDFTRWADVLAGCGAVLLVLSHAYAVFIVVRG